MGFGLRQITEALSSSDQLSDFPSDLFADASQLVHNRQVAADPQNAPHLLFLHIFSFQLL